MSVTLPRSSVETDEDALRLTKIVREDFVKQDFPVSDDRVGRFVFDTSLQTVKLYILDSYEDYTSKCAYLLLTVIDWTYFYNQIWREFNFGDKIRYIFQFSTFCLKAAMSQSHQSLTHRCFETKSFFIPPDVYLHHEIIFFMMRFVPTGCNAHVGHPRCHPIPHPLRNSIPLENVPDFIAKIKFSPNLIVEICPVYGGQKQVGAFGCIVLVRIQNVEFHGLQ